MSTVVWSFAPPAACPLCFKKRDPRGDLLVRTGDPSDEWIASSLLVHRAGRSRLLQSALLTCEGSNTRVLWRSLTDLGDTRWFDHEAALPHSSTHFSPQALLGTRGRHAIRVLVACSTARSSGLRKPHFLVVGLALGA
jgi:hypothetical protein